MLAYRDQYKDVSNLNTLTELDRQNVACGNVEALFTGLEQRLCEEIDKHEAVVGCVAWLTNERVLRALARKRAVALLVQKEDFLRPDVGGWSKEHLRRLYTALPASTRELLRLPYNRHGGPFAPLEGVRCLGIRAERNAIPPRMHHKFLVLGRIDELIDAEEFDPIKVWTGSFNVTANATRSLENAVLINDKKIASAYTNECRALMRWSEPLDWRVPYVDPQLDEMT